MRGATLTSQGLLNFSAALLPSHTLTSRRYSIWTALKRCVDEPFATVIASCSLDWDRQLLLGFAPSSAWRIPSRPVLERMAQHPEVAHGVLQLSTRRPKSRVAQIVAAIECWAECLRLVIRDATQDQFGDAATMFSATVDSVLSLFRRLSRRRPYWHLEPDFGRVSDKIVRPDDGTFCELCWRPSMRTEALKSRSNNFNGRRLSPRYCSHHNPSDSRSKYRTDLRYRAAFSREVEALFRFESSAYLLRIQPRSFDEEDVRKAAYALVHSRLRPLGARRPGLRERVFSLHARGLRQAEIACELGVSRQAVSKALKNLRTALSDPRC